MKIFFIYFIAIQFLYIHSSIPNWDLSKQSNTLNAPLSYTLYQKDGYGITVRLDKKYQRQEQQ